MIKTIIKKIRIYFQKRDLNRKILELDTSITSLKVKRDELHEKIDSLTELIQTKVRAYKATKEVAHKTIYGDEIKEANRSLQNIINTSIPMLRDKIGNLTNLSEKIKTVLASLDDKVAIDDFEDAILDIEEINDAYRLENDISKILESAGNYTANVSAAPKTKTSAKVAAEDEELQNLVGGSSEVEVDEELQSILDANN